MRNGRCLHPLSQGVDPGAAHVLAPPTLLIPPQRSTARTLRRSARSTPAPPRSAQTPSGSRSRPISPNRWSPLPDSLLTHDRGGQSPSDSRTTAKAQVPDSRPFSLWWRLSGEGVRLQESQGRLNVAENMGLTLDDSAESAAKGIAPEELSHSSIRRSNPSAGSSSTPFRLQEGPPAGRGVPPRRLPLAPALRASGLRGGAA